MPHYSLKDVFHEGTAYAERAATEIVRFTRGRLAANDNKPSRGAPLPVINPATWQGTNPPPQKWHVDGMIPARTVTMLGGDGGVGKSQLALQLAACTAIGARWLGSDVALGPCLYLGAEDDADEFHRRLARIARHYHREMADLQQLRIVPMADHDAVLATLDKMGRLMETDNLAKLRVEARALQPKLIVLDTSADLFGGNEIVRAQVRQFIGMLRALAMTVDCAVLLLSHPSLTGLKDGSGTSGSTGWSNSVRSRLYLDRHPDDPITRRLRVMKANYGPAGEQVDLLWQDGVFVIAPTPDGSAARLIDAKVDAVFLELLALFTSQNQNAGPSPGTSYAPAMMEKHPKAKGLDKRKFAAAMQRLLDAERIQIEVYGPPSKRRRRVVLVEDRASEDGAPESSWNDTSDQVERGPSEAEEENALEA